MKVHHLTLALAAAIPPFINSGTLGQSTTFTNTPTNP